MPTRMTNILKTTNQTKTPNKLTMPSAHEDEEQQLEPLWKAV